MTLAIRAPVGTTIMTTVAEIMTTRISRRTSSAASVVAARGVTSSCPEPAIKAAGMGPTNKVGRATATPAGSATTVAARNTSGITLVGTGPLARGAAARPPWACISTQWQTSRTCPEIGPSGPAPGGRPTLTSRSNASSRRRRNPPTVPRQPYPCRRRRPVRHRPPAPRRATLRCRPCPRRRPRLCRRRRRARPSR